ncbi:hypothetical protein CVT24_009468 [Panaeolus cyanescens]|uniref:Uncharacterized protein n=1 Tax=Panaeolus cyanescens TaxID=181874 RepID=A0A409WRT3_9AGAR|nr:hypothetical protein CVT24_009468 [Panaeolus cyanescens]
MNIFYNCDEARNRLKGYLCDQRVDSTETYHIQQMIQMDTAKMKVLRQTNNNLRSPRLVMEKGDGTYGEVCVRLPGILCRKVLPPVRRNISNTQPHVVRSMKQSVKLTGLGLGEYARFQEVINMVHTMFEDTLGKGTVQSVDCKPYEGHLSFDVGTRYFTDRDDAPTQEHVPFSRDDDPIFILELLRKDKFIHTEDNVVQYCSKVIMDGSEPSYMSAKSEIFQEGDIVEGHVAFACWPVGKDRYQLTLMLRALASLDTELRKGAWATAKSVRPEKSGAERKRGGKPENNISVKRHRIVYDMEE